MGGTTTTCVVSLISLFDIRTIMEPKLFEWNCLNDFHSHKGGTIKTQSQILFYRCTVHVGDYGSVAFNVSFLWQMTFSSFIFLILWHDSPPEAILIFLENMCELID